MSVLEKTVLVTKTLTKKNAESFKLVVKNLYPVFVIEDSSLSQENKHCSSVPY